MTSMIPITPNEYALRAIHGISAVSVILLNTSVLVVFAFKPKARGGNSTLLLASLISADCLVGIGGLLFLLFRMQVIQGVSSFGFTIVCMVVFLSASIANLCMVSLERFVAIILPLHYHLIGNTALSIMIGIAWILPMVAGAISTYYTFSVNPFQVFEIYKKLYIYLVTCGLIGVFVLLVVNVCIFSEVRRQIRSIASATVEDDEPQTDGNSSSKLESSTSADTQKAPKCGIRSRLRKREIRTFYICLAMVTTFVICWIPTFALVFGFILNNFALTTPFMMEFVLIAIVINGATDPILYVLMSSNLRTAYRLTYFGCKKESTILQTN